MHTRYVVTIAGVVAGLGLAVARADDGPYADDPTGAIDLPPTALAGDQDARAAVVNPGGLYFLDGQSLVVAASGGAPSDAASTGAGVGGFARRRSAGGSCGGSRWGPGSRSGCRRGPRSRRIRARRRASPPR
jgi:hypothetical protein